MVVKISKYLIVCIVICIQSFCALTYAAEHISLAYNLDSNQKPIINKMYYGSLKKAPINLNELSHSRPRGANKRKAYKISNEATKNKKEDYDFKIDMIKEVKSAKKSAISDLPFFGGLMILPKNATDFEKDESQTQGTFKSFVLGVLFPISKDTYLELAYKYLTYNENRTFVYSDNSVLKFSNVSNYYSGLSLTYILKYSLNRGLFIFGGAGLSYNSFKMIIDSNTLLDIAFHEDSQFSPTMKIGVNYNNFEFAYNSFGESLLTFQGIEYKIDTTAFTLMYHFKF